MITPDELLYSVDDSNQPINPQSRALSHQTGIWHRSCHVWIVGSDRMILCQQRSMLKDSNPGCWEPFFGGHLHPGQEYVDAAESEVREELGLNVTSANLRYFGEYKYVPGSEFQGIFATSWIGDPESLELEMDEVQKVEWKIIKDVERLVVDLGDHHWTVIGYERNLLNWLKQNF